MQHLSEILEGYCDPVRRKYAIKVVGETGLNVRVRSLCYFDGAIRSMMRPRFYEFAHSDFPSSYGPILRMLGQCWTTEFLRITDKPRFGEKGKGKENLTIALFHERFQEDISISSAFKRKEDTLFQAIDQQHKANLMWEFRCQAWFHLDLETNLKAPHERGDIHLMTELVLAWYRFVGSVVNGPGEPAFVTKAGLEGKRFVGELRRMIFAQKREWLRLQRKHESKLRESSRC